MHTLRTSLSILVLGLLAFLGREARAAVSVVATTPDLAAIARDVGGKAVQVSTLAVPTQDPHFVDARPNLALAMNKADLLLLQGLDLEVGWLPTLLGGARNPKIQVGSDGYIDCSRFVSVLEVPAGQVSRAQGDIHPGGNPHYLLDPRNGAKVARGVAEKLAQLDPPHAADFRKNAADLEKAASDMAGSLASRFSALDAGKRKVVVYHRSWVYLEGWLGLTEVGAVEPKPGIPPDPAHVARTLVLMRGQAVHAILSEEYYPQTTSRLLADKAGAALVVVHGGAGPSQPYLDHVRELANTTYAALSK